MRHTLLYIAAALSLTLPLAAQTTITFDTDDYAAVSIYDAWEASPFRLGLLTGNVGVTDNPYTAVDDFLGFAPNETSKVLAVQRSRYGSNQFGARIDLKEPFSLSPEMQYVHVLLHRPVSGRVMLMGLGKHREAEWAGQSKETEQFWAISTNTVTPDKWTDAVFAVQGVSGVDIYSLVVVPECESPHDRTEDFIAYIDQIEVNSNAKPTVQYEDYPTSFNKETTYASRTDRGILSVSLRGVDTLTLTASPATSDLLFRDRCETAFAVKPGQTLKPLIGYKGTWMCAYAYVDFGRDGKLSYDINADGTPADGSDLVSYSAYNQRNSAGKTLANNNTLDMPEFTLPADLATGFYRLRFKVDWDEIDPAGAATIQENGGGIVDLRLNVHPDNVSVSEDNRNGEILSADGSALPASVPFGQPLTIKLRPENGFSYNGVRVRHGYNLTGDSLLHSTPQYIDLTIWRDQFDDDNCYTLPAALVDGDLMLEGLFVEKGTELSFDYPINFDKETLIERTDRHLDGVSLGNQTVSIANDRRLYREDMTQTFYAAPGQLLATKFTYTGTWMNGFVYIDRDQNGKFSYAVKSNGVPADGSDLMAYSHADGKNSKGNTVNGNTLNPPTFTVPADMEDGFYRLRFKVDWNALDPGGNTADGNLITSNGGAIADYRLRVYSGDEVSISVEPSPNGDLRAMGNIELPLTTQYRQSLAVLAVPFEGYRIDTLFVTHGNLAGDAVKHSVPQRQTDIFTAQDFTGDVIQLPASVVDGDLLLRAVFAEGDITGIAADAQCSMFNVQSSMAYTLDGRPMPLGPLPKGIYIIRYARGSQKLIVR